MRRSWPRGELGENILLVGRACAKVLRQECASQVEGIERMKVWLKIIEVWGDGMLEGEVREIN